MLFACLSAGAGYVLALWTHKVPVDFALPFPFLWLMAGLYLLVSGSFALNQAYEWRWDSLMRRTQKRPVPAGKLSPFQAFSLGLFLSLAGLFILLALKPLTAGLGLLAVLLYNVFYTVYWKKKWVFSAVPGALPGALPVMIGWSVPSSELFSPACLYLFFLLFLWQMPHFWSLALHYKEDYRSAGFPVLPLKAGENQTLCFMGFYLVAYLGLVLLSPLFFKMNVVYLFLLIPFCVKVFWAFLQFSKKLEWKPFFMWLNLSVLVFLYAPALQLWLSSLIA